MSLLFGSRSKTTQIQISGQKPKKNVNSKLVNSFIWTDDEVELFTKCDHGEQNVESQGEYCSLAQVGQLICKAALVVDSLTLAKSLLNKDGISTSRTPSFRCIYPLQRYIIDLQAIRTTYS